MNDREKLIEAVVDYIARNYRCTFPAAWDTGDGIQAPGRFALPTSRVAEQARPERDALVKEISAVLAAEPEQENLILRHFGGPPGAWNDDLSEPPEGESE